MINLLYHRKIHKIEFGTLADKIISQRLDFFDRVTFGDKKALIIPEANRSVKVVHRSHIL